MKNPFRKKNKIYLVTSLGYCIHRAFSSVEKAEEFINNNNGFEIEEYDVDIKDNIKVRNAYYIRIRIQDGEVIQKYNYPQISDDNHTEIHKEKSILRILIIADSEELAVKIAIEKRQEYLKEHSINLLKVNAEDWLEDNTEQTNICNQCGIDFKGYPSRGACKVCIQGRERAYHNNCEIKE